VAVLPVDNLAGRQVPKKELRAAVEAAVGAQLEIVTGDLLEQFLSRHRIRFTGGLDGEDAAAAREELGVDAVLLTEVEVYSAASPPRLAMGMRLVSASQEPVILWIDHVSLAGDEAPGLLGLGVLHEMKDLEVRVLARLTASLQNAIEGKGGAGGERPSVARRYGPRIHFRGAGLDAETRYRVAVLPFFNLSGRRGAGDAVAMEFVHQLVATRQYDVVEPGVVRDYLLRARVFLPGGVSLEATRLLLGALGADLVLSGVVLDYDDGAGPAGPTICFSATVLETDTGMVMWHSTSLNHGNDGVYAFGLGRVTTPSALTTRMVVPIVEALAPGAMPPSRPREIAEGTGRLDVLRGRARPAPKPASPGSGSGPL
jgi:hypothetical protein